MTRTLLPTRLATLTLTLSLLLAASLPALATPRVPGRVNQTKRQVSTTLQWNLMRISNRAWHCAVPVQDVTIKARRIQPGRSFGFFPGRASTDRRIDTRLVSWRTQVNGLDFKGCCVACTQPGGAVRLSKFQILQKPAGLTIPGARPQELRPERLTAAERRFFGSLLQQ